MLLRIAVQAKGRLYDETMSFLGESDIKLNAVKRSLLVQSSNFPVEVLFYVMMIFRSLWQQAWRI